MSVFQIISTLSIIFIVFFSIPLVLVLGHEYVVFLDKKNNIKRQKKFREDLQYEIENIDTFLDRELSKINDHKNI